MIHMKYCLMWRKEYVKKVSQIVLIFGIAFSLSACTETKDSNESKQEDVQDKVYKIGETVDVDGLQVTIDSVKLGYPDYDEDKKKEEILGLFSKWKIIVKRKYLLHFMNLRLSIRKVQDLKNIITLIALLVKVSTR